MTQTLARRLRESAERNDLKGFEDVWVEMMEHHPAEVSTFIAGIDALHAKGLMDKASTFLGALAPVLLERQLYAEAIVALRRLAALNPREKGLRSGLLTAYKALYAADERLPVLLEKSGLESGGEIKPSVDKLETFLGFVPGRYVFHPAGWGAGRVLSVDLGEMQVVMDFETTKGRKLALEMAAKVTQFIEADDLRAMRFDRQDQLLALVENDPVALIRAALKSRGGKSSLRDIRDRIAPAVIPTARWSSFWNKAKVQVKAAPDLALSPGANPVVEFSATDRGYASTCLRDLALLVGDEDKCLKYLKALLPEAKKQPEGKEAVTAVATRLMEISVHFDQGCMISLAFLLLDCKTFVPELTIPDKFALADLCREPRPLLRALEQIPVNGHCQAAVQLLRPRLGDSWPQFAEALLRNGEPESAELALSDLISTGRADAARTVMRGITERFRDHPAAFLWYLRASIADALPKEIAREGLITLLEKALMLHEHLAMGDNKPDSEKRIARSIVSTLQSRDYEMVRNAFLSCSAEAGINAANMIRYHRSIYGETRDQMLARMFRARPELGRMQPGGVIREQAPTNPLFDDAVLFCTEEGLLRKRKEFEDLVNRQIPENATEIGRAASYGDLSENSEWTAAIEKQSRLTRHSEELGADLARARVMDATQQDGLHVGLGSRVTVTDVSGANETYTILGPWEVDPDNGRISYLSDLGRAVIGKSVGDSVVVESPRGQRQLRIAAVGNGLV